MASVDESLPVVHPQGTTSTDIYTDSTTDDNQPAKASSSSLSQPAAETPAGQASPEKAPEADLISALSINDKRSGTTPQTPVHQGPAQQDCAADALVNERRQCRSFSLAPRTLAPRGPWWKPLAELGRLVATKLTVVLALWLRVINLLIAFASWMLTRLPLSLRWTLAKMYHRSGPDSGRAVFATVWLFLYTAGATYLTVTGSPAAPSAAIMALTYCLDALLLAIIWLAVPTLHARCHNALLASQRFLPLASVALLVADRVVVYSSDPHPCGYTLSLTPYLLFAVTVSILAPYLFLRKVPVDIAKPSDDALIVHLPDRGPALPGPSCAISVDTKFDWHSFVTIPKEDGAVLRLLIPRAGGWAARVIDDPPSHFWVKGIATAGFSNIESLFRRVLYVCTGPGIGAAMPHLIARRVPCALLWCVRAPEKTYGPELLDEVLRVCPDSTISDAHVKGGADMVEEIFRHVVRIGAEAVICVSNQRLTRRIVHSMESKGIPAFGVIGDS